MGEIKDTNNTTESMQNGVKTVTTPTVKVTGEPTSSAQQADWKERIAQSEKPIDPHYCEEAKVATPTAESPVQKNN